MIFEDTVSVYWNKNWLQNILANENAKTHLSYQLNCVNKNDFLKITWNRKGKTL